MKRVGQFLVAVAMLALATPAFAQTTGIISGTVTASTGLALPGEAVISSRISQSTAAMKCKPTFKVSPQSFIQA